MGNSQKNSNVVDLLPQIADLDEQLRFLCGAANDDSCIRGLAVSLHHAKRMSGEIRLSVESLTAEQAIADK